MIKNDEHRLLTPIETVLQRYGKKVSDVELIKHPSFNFLVNGYRSGKTVRWFYKPVDITDSYCNIVHDGIFRFGYYKIPDKVSKILKSLLHKPIKILLVNGKDNSLIFIDGGQWFEISFDTHIKRIKLLIDDVPQLRITEVDSRYLEFDHPLQIKLDSIAIYAKTYQYKVANEVTSQTTSESAIKLVAANWQCLIFTTNNVFTMILNAVNEEIIDPLEDIGFKIIKTLI